MLALAVSGVYFGLQVMEGEFAYRSVREASRQQVVPGIERSDEEIRANLLSRIDELDLPPAARDIRIRRQMDGSVAVSLSYEDTVRFFDRWEWVRARRVDTGRER